MAQDRLEECLQAVAGGTDSRATERGRWMRFVKGKISERIQLRPTDLPILFLHYALCSMPQ